MGRAARWFRSLWRGNKEDKENCSNYGGLYDRKDKKRWSFAKSASDSNEEAFGKNAPTAAAFEAGWFRSSYAGNEKEDKHAFAVAAATESAANAAAVAAQASAALVRLEKNGKGVDMFVGIYEREAAVRIQAAFRRYLAKKALRALKGLVKLQALVRGYLVRKQAAATLHSMQAIVRAQTSVRAQRTRNIPSSDRSLRAELRPRMSIERFDEARRENLSLFHRRRLSSSVDSSSNGFDRSHDIVEMDACRPKSRSSRRTSPSFFGQSDDSNSNSMSSPLPHCKTPVQIIIPNCRNLQDYDWRLAGQKCRVSATAHSTPRYMSASRNAPVTPTKSAFGANGSLRRPPNDPNCPNYMTNTQSFVAKTRSQSAPRQRPEPAGMRKRVPLSEIMLEARASLSGAGMQRSCNRAHEAFSFKSAVVGKIERSSEFGRNSERESYFHWKW